MTTASTLQTGHVGLNVTNLERSVAFYEQILGLSTLRTSEDEDRRYAFLGDGERLVITLWQQSDGRARTDLPGLHHLSFQVPTVDEVRRAEERVRGFGVLLHHDGAVAHSEGAASGGIFFEDPDGIRLEIYAPVGGHDMQAPTGSAPACGFF